ncbi:MAG: hypothetical protein Tsb0010_14880 [Parvularculaceae bacterium]
MKLLHLGLAAAASFAAHNASAEVRVLERPAFDEIEVARGVELELVMGDTQSIEIEGDSDDFDRLYVEVEDGKLEIRSRGVSLFGRSPKFRARVTATALNGLYVNTGAEAQATGVDAVDFRLAASTGGYAEISGRCDALEADVSTGGEIEAEAFECRMADADASTGGHMSIYASDTVEADASTGGSIVVYGNPQSVDRDRSTGGSIEIRS